MPPPVPAPTEMDDDGGGGGCDCCTSCGGSELDGCSHSSSTPFVLVAVEDATAVRWAGRCDENMFRIDDDDLLDDDFAADATLVNCCETVAPLLDMPFSLMGISALVIGDARANRHVE